MARRRSQLRTRARFGVVLAVLTGVASLGGAETHADRPRHPGPSSALRALEGCGEGIDANPRVAVLDTATHAGHGAATGAIIGRLAPSAVVISIPVLDDDGRGDAAVVAGGIDRAIAEGFDLVNLSAWLPNAPAIDAALRRADEAGVVVVVAAGNEGRDLDRSPTWRGRSDLDCVLVVGASEPDGRRRPGSNRGAVVVEVVAPGHAIPTADAAGRVGVVEGTSAAAAVVTGQLASG